MILDRVTITGADESVDVSALRKLHEDFPFVEFGILLSEIRMGTRPRYPSRQWLWRLHCEDAGHGKTPLPLAAHICGNWSENLLGGGNAINFLGDILYSFKRVQINFTAEKEDRPALLEYAMRSYWHRYGPKQFIIQANDANREFYESLRDCETGAEVVPLFDRSGGKGELPGAWPAAEYIDMTPGPDGNGVECPIYHGYAGGLGPDTLEAELPKIAEAAGDARIWIDMETRVRSDADRIFDLKKVRRCLEICAPLIGTTETRG